LENNGLLAAAVGGWQCLAMEGLHIQTQAQPLVFIEKLRTQ
jgi:hypothetical protein